MSKKYYRLYCEICNWKKITDGADAQELVTHKTAPVPGGVPKLDPVGKKVTVSKPVKQPKKYKCPNCGRLVTPRKITNPQEKIDLYNEQILRAKERREWETVEQEALRRYEKSKEEYEEEQDRIDRS